MKYQVTIDQIAEAMNNAKKQGKGVTLLLGSGCSTKSGIPDSAGLVKAIKKDFPKVYEDAENKSYHALMALLNPEQHKLIYAKYLEQAKINWAHISSAVLMQKGFVDRILTTNFDNLTVRACQYIGEYPALYDCVAGKINAEQPLWNKSIVHLHGQRPSAMNLHDKEPFATLYDSMEPVFQDAADRMLIIVGYRGDMDPALKHLANVKTFQSGLYWIGHKKSEPPKKILESFLGEEKGGFYYGNMDADAFLVSLTQKLEVFPPEFVMRPYSHLNRLAGAITPFVLPGQSDEIDVTMAIRGELTDAIKQVEQYDPSKSPKANKDDEESRNIRVKHSVFTAQSYLMSGNPERVLVYHDLYRETQSPQLAELLFGAYIMQGNALREKANGENEKTSASMFKMAAEKYQAACEIKPDKGDALYHWGTVLIDQAKREKDDNKEMLYNQAAEKFQNAVKLNSSWYQAYQAWGTSVFELGMFARGKKAEPLFAQAIKIFQAALAIREDLPETLFGLGKAMVQQARWTKGGDAVQLFAQAMKNFQAALSYHPNHYQALTSWGHVLTKMAENLEIEEADALLTEAQEKYKCAIKINPENYQAYLGWGRALWKRGEQWEDIHADSLFKQAMEKFQAALSRKPALPEALFGWGNVLYTMSLGKRNEDAIRSLNEAADKFKATLEHQANNTEAYHCWGKTLLQLGDHLEGEKAETTYDRAAEKFQEVLAIRPQHSEALSNWGKVFLHLARIRKGKEKTLLSQAGEKFQAALDIRPDNADALNQWGTALFKLAQSKDYKEAEEFYCQAEEKYQAALDIQPNFAEAFNNWGWILLQKAKGFEGKDKDRDPLFKQASEKFKSAIDIDPNNWEAYINWGASLMDHAKTKRGIEVHPLLSNAKRKFLQAEELLPGSGAYLLARLMALLANETGCREWLQKCKKLGALPEYEVWTKEQDFTYVRNSKWFTNLLPPVQTQAKPPTASESKGIEKDISGKDKDKGDGDKELSGSIEFKP
jgi:tetratricopeptide (TPR) repeat protein